MNEKPSFGAVEVFREGSFGDLWLIIVLKWVRAKKRSCCP